MKYVGIDVHKNYCVSTIEDKSGKVLEELRTDNNKDGIMHLICRLSHHGKPNEVKVAMESTANG